MKTGYLDIREHLASRGLWAFLETQVLRASKDRRFMDPQEYPDGTASLAYPENRARGETSDYPVKRGIQDREEM